MKKIKRYIVGIDIGGTNIKIGLVDPKGTVYRKLVIQTKALPTKERLIDGLVTAVEKLLRTNRLAVAHLVGIGVGSPGLVNNQKGIIHYLVNIRGFKEVPLKRILEQRLGVPAHIDNDVNVICLGELCFGEGKGATNMVCITLGTGVGGGVVVNGKLYRGSTYSAGEVGHITINEHGPQCNCGNNGCLEAYVGNAYIVKDAIAKLAKNRTSLIYTLAGRSYEKITPKIISEAANKGDRLAQAILREVGSHIGAGLANIINILNPDRIVIGGGVAGAGKILFDSIRETVQKRAMDVPAQAATIVQSKLGQDAGLIGAAALVMQAELAHPLRGGSAARRTSS